MGQDERYLYYHRVFSEDAFDICFRLPSGRQYFVINFYFSFCDSCFFLVSFRVRIQRSLVIQTMFDYIRLHLRGMGISLMERQQVFVFDVLSIMTPRLEKKTLRRKEYAATFYVIRSRVTRFKSQVRTQCSLLRCDNCDC